jgi:hypothetical protein
MTLKRKSFENKYNLVENWITEHNRLPLLNASSAQETKLAKWCSIKRSDYKKGVLMDYQIKKLENLKEWHWISDIQFEVLYQELKKWTERYKKIPSHNSKDIKERKLGTWCIFNKWDKSRSKLSDEKVKRLELIPGWIWPDFSDCSYQSESSSDSERDNIDDDKQKKQKLCHEYSC